MWGLKAGQTANAKTQIRVCLIFFEDSEKAGVPKEEWAKKNVTEMKGEN